MSTGKSLLSLVLLGALSFSGACADDYEVDTGDDLQDNSTSALMIVPVLIDQKTREWAESTESALYPGQMIGSGVPGFREGYALLHQAMENEASAIAYSVSFGATFEDNLATQALGTTFSKEATLTVLNRNSLEDRLSPRIYESVTSGHMHSQGLYVDDADGFSRIYLNTSEPNLEVPSLPEAAFEAMLIGQGIDKAEAALRSAAAVDCASVDVLGEVRLVAVDYSDVVDFRSLNLGAHFDALISGFEALRTQMTPIAQAPAISARDILTGEKTIPRGALVFVGAAEDVLPPVLDSWEGPAALDWNASAPVMNTRIAAQLVLCDENSER